MPQEAWFILGPIIVIVLLVGLLQLQNRNSDDERYRVTPSPPAPSPAPPPPTPPAPLAVIVRQVAPAHREEPPPRWDDRLPEWEAPAPPPPPRSHREEAYGLRFLSISEALAGMALGYTLERHRRGWGEHWWLLPPSQSREANSFQVDDQTARGLVAHPNVRDVSAQHHQAPGHIYVYVGTATGASSEYGGPYPAEPPPRRALAPRPRSLPPGKDSN